MERLTKWIDGKAVLQECNGPCKSCNGVLCEDVFQVFDRLAAYEDTGIEPKEVAEYQHLCDSYVKAGLDAKFVQFCIDTTQNGLSIDRLCELARAEKDGRLVVLSPNDSLTLEELQEMNGEPVWVCGIRRNRYMPSEWATVYLKWQGCKTASGGIVFFDRYNDTWIAYRRKPSE